MGGVFLMYRALLQELKKKGKIKDGSIEFYTENGELKVLVDKTTHSIRDNNTLVNLSNKNRQVSKAVDMVLGEYF